MSKVIKSSNNQNAVVKRLLILACFLSPFYTLRVGGIFFTISDLLFSLVFIYLVLTNRLKINKQSLIKVTPVFLGVFLIIFGFYLSVIINGYSDGIVTEPLQYIFVYLILPITILFANEEAILKMIKAYLWGIVVVIVIGAFLLTFFPSVYKNLESMGVFIGVSRMGSFLGANGLSKNIAVGIPLLILIKKLNLIRSKTFVYFVLSFFVGLLLTSSFGGLLASVLSLITFYVLTYLFIKGKETNKKIKYLLIFLLVLSSILFINERYELNLTSVFQDRVVNTIYSGEIEEAGSFTIKMSLMEEAWRIISGNPIIGIGAGNFKEQNMYLQNVHNAYLSLWVESGLVSLIGFIIILVTPIFYSLVCLRKNSNKFKLYGITTFVIMLTFCFNLLTSTSIYVRSTILPIILILILMVKGIYNLSRDNY